MHLHLSVYTLNTFFNTVKCHGFLHIMYFWDPQATIGDLKCYARWAQNGAEDFLYQDVNGFLRKGDSIPRISQTETRC